MLTIRRLCLALMLCLVSTALVAQSLDARGPKNYLIFKVSDLSIDDDLSRMQSFLFNSYGLDTEIATLNYEFPDLAYRLVDGWLFSKHLGLEGELVYYDEYNVNITTTSGETITIRRQGYSGGLSLFGQYRVLKNLDIYGKGGFAFWRVDSKIQGAANDLPPKIHDDSIEFTFGAGVRYSLNDRFLLDLSYEKADLEGFDVDTLTLGFGFRY